MQTEIVTPRLRLAPIRPCDSEGLMAMLAEEEVGRTYMVPDLSTPQQREALFGRLLAVAATQPHFVWGIYREGTPVGMVHDVDQWPDGVEIGYVIHPAYKGQGYATEALRAVIAALFDRGYRVVKAGAFEDNAASLRVMAKCGMVPIDEEEMIDYRGQAHRCVYRAIRAKAQRTQ